MKKANSKKKNYKSNPKDISLKYLKQILDVISLIETGGFYYNSENKGFISAESISNILLNIQEVEKKDDWTRTIKTAKRVFNDTCKYSEIRGDRRGSFVDIINEKNEKKELKNDPGYQALFIIGLAILSLEGSLNLDFLNQFFMQKYPIGLLLFLSYSVQQKAVLTLRYKSDRTDSETVVEKFVPAKINFRDGHWVLIGMELKNKVYIQYLLHSVIELKFYRKRTKDDVEFYRELAVLDLQKFYENSFGLSVLNQSNPVTAQIEVPEKFKEKIVKRRKEGTWVKQDQVWLWTVKSNNPDEIIDYLFKWNGELKIISPDSLKQRYAERLKNQLSLLMLEAGT